MSLSREELLAYFSKDVFATQTVGILVDSIEDDRAVCRLPLTEVHRNADGQVMGGVSFTLGDFTASLLANREKLSTVSLSANIHYLGAAKGQELIAEATMLKEGRRIVTVAVSIRDELNTPVAYMTMGSFRSN